MAGLNRVMLIGNLGRDPEIKFTQNGLAVTNFSIATSEQWTDKTSGQKQEKTEWHNCVAFGKPAEILEKYLSKGSQVYVEGSLTTDQYEKDGQTHYSTKIKIQNFQFLGGKQDSQGGGNSQGNQGGQQNQQGQHGGYQQGQQGNQNNGQNIGYQGNNQGNGQQNQGNQQSGQGQMLPPDDTIPF